MAQSGFNVQTFISSVSKNGVMRNNKFLVRIPMPRGMLQSSASNRLQSTSRFIELWCESTNIPGVSLSTNEIRRYGYGNVEKKPYVSINNDVNFSFLSDGDGEIWSFFQQWIRMIVNYDMRNGIDPQGRKNGVLAGQNPWELAYKYEYVSDVEVIVFDEQGHDVLTVVLREAYPTFVGDVQLNWGDTNNIARIPVTMTVYDWYNIDQTFDRQDSPPLIRAQNQTTPRSDLPSNNPPVGRGGR